MIRVLIVDDSPTVRERLVEVVGGDPDFEVAGCAGDGALAIELCQRLRPDVVTMDIVLPGTSGLEATEQIMAFCPTPILIVSSADNRRDMFSTYDALAAGAVDVLEKPTGDEESWAADLLSALRVVARVRVITHPRLRLTSPERPRPGPRRPGGFRLVAIGASTGGPSAVRAILAALPKDFPLSVLVVLHVSEPFGLSLADWLNSHSRLPVRCARGGEVLDQVTGQVLLAPPGSHLVLQGGRLQLSQSPPRHSCRPSVDVLFESVASEARESAIACLLTGMGKDGAQGLLKVRERGGFTLAQDEATSVVFGMPGEAALLGAAAEVVPLEGVVPRLLQLLERASCP